MTIVVEWVVKYTTFNSFFTLMLDVNVYFGHISYLLSDILSDQKRVKLLMQIFLFSAARSERLALKKLVTWWHFIVVLKERVSVQFEKVHRMRNC